MATQEILYDSIKVMEFNDGKIGFLVVEGNGDFHTFTDVSRAVEFVKRGGGHVA